MRNLRLLTIALVLVLGLSATAFAYQEAPTLAAKVRSGELPPVEERVPKNPLVVEPIEEIGTYSSRVIRMAHRGPSDSTGYYRTVREPLVNYNPSLTEANQTWPKDGRFPRTASLSPITCGKA